MTDKKMLTERAYAAVEAHKAVYYREGDYVKADFWDYAEIFEIIEDLYEVTGDKALFAQFEEMYQYVLKRYTEDWHKNPYNDDIMWLVIALTRAYLYTGEKKYLDTAVRNFRTAYDRAVSGELGGGLFWRIENQCKNTCVNCPMLTKKPRPLSKSVRYLIPKRLSSAMSGADDVRTGYRQDLRLHQPRRIDQPLVIHVQSGNLYRCLHDVL